LYSRPAKGGVVINDEPFMSVKVKEYARKLDEILKNR